MKNEFKEYLNFFKKNLLIILIFTIAGGLIGYFYSKAQPLKYEASTNIYISKASEIRNERYYTYEGYYSQLAAKEYTDTAIGLLKSLDLIRTIRESNISPQQIQANLKVRKIAPSVINLSLVDENPKVASELVTKLAKNLDQKIAFLNQDSDNRLVAKTLEEESFISSIKIPIKLNIAVGVFSAFLLGIVISSLASYYKPK